MMMARRGRGRGRGRRGRPRGIGQTPSVFDQQTFAEAIGITANAIAQAGIAGRQEDPNNLQMTRPDPDTPQGFPGWSRLVEFHCTIPRECTKGPHLKEK